MATWPVRRRRALDLRARGREFSRRARKQWAEAEAAARVGDRLRPDVPAVWPWHETRARGLEEHFTRLETCGELWQVVQRCTSADCASKRAKGDEGAGIKRYELGCCSRFFCRDCRSRIAQRFRRDFNAARLGLTWQCGLAGLTKKYRRGGRFSERLITLAPPHVGTCEERIDWNFSAWEHFLKSLNAWCREKYQLRDEDGEPLRDAEGELRYETARFRVDDDIAGTVENDVRIFELVQHARFWEVTKGSDGEGHPHFHVWHWGPYVPHELLEQWWREAWERASKHKVPPGKDGVARIMVDVRKVVGDIVEARDEHGAPIVDEKTGRPITTRLDRELVKYLTKDLDLPPALMARIYGELLGRRARQASSAFYSSWMVPILHVCDDCGAVHQRGADEGPMRWSITPAPGSYAEEHQGDDDELAPPMRAPDGRSGIDWTEADNDPRVAAALVCVGAAEREPGLIAARRLMLGLRALAGKPPPPPPIVPTSWRDGARARELLALAGHMRAEATRR